MSAPTAADYQNSIISLVGDPNGTMRLLVLSLWNIYAAQAPVSPILQFLYTKRAVLDARLAEEWSDTDFVVGNDVEDKQSQRFAHLQQMRDDTHAEIIRLEARLRARRGPATGSITTVAPTAPPSVGAADANDPIYQGSPYDRWPQW